MPKIRPLTDTCRTAIVEGVTYVSVDDALAATERSLERARQEAVHWSTDNGPNAYERFQQAAGRTFAHESQIIWLRSAKEHGS